MLTAQTYHSHAHAAPIDTLSLTYEGRFLRRKVLTTVSGAQVLIDLPKTTSLDHGGVVITTEGAEIAVAAAPEALLQVTGEKLHRLAWHIGNRHTPCQIEDTRLLIQPDKVIREMLGLLGATVVEVTEPFTPEGGAYGHGRTHGHDHSHSHGPDTHTHDHAHEH